MDFNKWPYNQWILNSDRLVLNAKKENIFLLAAKDLSVSTQGDVHLDTKGTFIANANKIQLGIDKNNLQPIAKGQSVVDSLNSILLALNSFSESLASATGQGVGVISLVQVNTAASKLMSDLQQVQKGINDIKSTLTFSD